MHYFHVISTANHDRPVFEDPAAVSDLYRGFDAVTELGVEVAAYAVMSAHVHKLIGIADSGGLPAAVSRVIAPTAFSINRRAQQRGSIFRPTFWRAEVIGDAYMWVLPLYIHSNPAPECADLRRLNVGLRTSHELWTGTRAARWHTRGLPFAQYGGRYLDALEEYLDQRRELRRQTRGVPECFAPQVLAVSRATGVRPATLQDRTRGGKRDRMLLAWVLGSEVGVVAAANVLDVNRETAARWGRVVQDDASFEAARRSLTRLTFHRCHR